MNKVHIINGINDAIIQNSEITALIDEYERKKKYLPVLYKLLNDSDVIKERINEQILEFSVLKNKLIDISKDGYLNDYNKNRILKTLKK